MRKRILVALSALFVFGLFAGVFALSETNASAGKTEVSCPMQKQTAASGGDHKDSCCGMADCCKDGKCSMNDSCCKYKDSCPMKKSQRDESAQTIDMSNVVVVKSDGGGDDCCQPGADCCKNGGGSCCRRKS